jgi:H+/Cl- antiporter ClcA
MCITYGTNVPAGLFLPGVIVGCAMGDLIYVAAESVDIFENQNEAAKDGIRHSYIIMGCAAFMAGYTRMTYCLAILIMETT